MSAIYQQSREGVSWRFVPISSNSPRNCDIRSSNSTVSVASRACANGLLARSLVGLCILECSSVRFLHQCAQSVRPWAASSGRAREPPPTWRVVAFHDQTAKQDELWTTRRASLQLERRIWLSEQNLRLPGHHHNRASFLPKAWAIITGMFVYS